MLLLLNPHEELSLGGRKSRRVEMVSDADSVGADTSRHDVTVGDTVIIDGVKLAVRRRQQRLHCVLQSQVYNQHRDPENLTVYFPNSLSRVAYLWPPYGIGQAIIFLSCGFFLSSFFSSPNLSGCRLEVYHTSTHGIALVRI